MVYCFPSPAKAEEYPLGGRTPQQGVSKLLCGHHRSELEPKRTRPLNSLVFRHRRVNFLTPGSNTTLEVRPLNTSLLEN